MTLIRVRCCSVFNGAGKMLLLRARQLRVSQLYFDMEALCPDGSDLDPEPE